MLARLDVCQHDDKHHQDNTSPRDGGGKDRSKGKRSPQKPREEDLTPPLGAIIDKGHQGGGKQKGPYDAINAFQVKNVKNFRDHHQVHSLQVFSSDSRRRTESRRAHCTITMT